MGIVTVTLATVGGAVLLMALAGVAFVDRSGLGALRRNYRERARSLLPYLGALAGVLVVNRVARSAGPDVSWIIGWEITDTLYAIEGPLVATIQSVRTPWLTGYLSFVYLPGYVFLLSFPVVLYITAASERPLKETIAAYTVNYSLGALCYVLFVSFGPRNLLPGMVEPLLYAVYPDTQVLTGEVNSNSNVFPSLHTSLSVTVAALAVRHDAVSRGWTYVAGFAAVSVAVATMYLGIHWASDVVAGTVLGVGSVLVARRIVDWERERRR